MTKFFDDPWPWVVMVAIIAAATLIALAITREYEVDPDMQACLDAGGSYLDMTHNDLCLMGTMVEQ